MSSAIPVSDASPLALLPFWSQRRVRIRHLDTLRMFVYRKRTGYMLGVCRRTVERPIELVYMSQRYGMIWTDLEFAFTASITEILFSDLHARGMRR